MPNHVPDLIRYSFSIQWFHPVWCRLSAVGTQKALVNFHSKLCRQGGMLVYSEYSGSANPRPRILTHSGGWPRKRHP